jgi:hypothetical protein
MSKSFDHLKNLAVRDIAKAPVLVKIHGQHFASMFLNLELIQNFGEGWRSNMGNFGNDERKGRYEFCLHKKT